MGRVLGDGGGFDGLCAGQFILLFFACLNNNRNPWLNWIIIIFLQGYFDKIPTGLLISSIIAIKLFFSLFCTIGWSKQSAKTILKQPTLILLPIFTFFTFAKMGECCGGKQDFRLKLSKRYTVINFIIDTLICIPLAVIYFKTVLRVDWKDDSELFHIYTLFLNLFIPPLLTFIFLFRYPSCSWCCISCCVGGQQVIHVYDPDLPHQEFVFRNGEVIRKDQDNVSEILEQQVQQPKQVQQQADAAETGAENVNKEEDIISVSLNVLPVDH